MVVVQGLEIDFIDCPGGTPVTVEALDVPFTPWGSSL